MNFTDFKMLNFKIYCRFLLCFSFLRFCQLMILTTTKGNKQMGMIMIGLKPFLSIRAIEARKRRVIDTPSITVSIFIFCSLLISSSSVYSDIGLLLILVFFDDFQGSYIPDRCNDDVFISL